MKVSFDKYFPVVQPSIYPTQTDLFAKRVERLDAERSLQTQVTERLKKFHQYEWEIYEMRMKQLVINIQVVNQNTEIDKLV